MEISEARLPVDADEIVEFVVKRTPGQDRAVLRADLDLNSARSLRVLVAREADGAMAGVALARASANLPAGALFVMVVTRADCGGRGLGSRLFAAVLAEPADDVTRLVGCVLDGDQVSMDVALRWGFERRQTSITSACVLDGAVSVEPPRGVTVEVCDDLTFDDEEGVEAMLRASQTNPEADLGLVLTLSGLRRTPAPGQRPVAVLTRVEGRPAAIAFAVADGDQMHLMYTGVDPNLRGRALGRCTKALMHAHAHGLGIRMALTENDESNAGIRHVNDQLGYTPHSAWHWMMRPLQ
ncbi:GNAT family N-acetyltransferase [Nocardioides koreensis]|uniref:GNAT family N-acetyltransferase n=1 Tax=Nocardioides koreensis TaxID=433651 RepID=A0ABN2ZZT1_9ACTN